MLQETAERLQDTELFDDPIIIAHEDHRFLVAEHLSRIGVKNYRLALEPARRNTAAAIASAMLLAAQRDSDAVMVVLPADHMIRDARAFRRAMRIGFDAASSGRLVTFGITPTRAETGYGYIRSGAAIGGLKSTFEINRFVEKPSADDAAKMIIEGGYFWNSGIFVLPVRTLAAEFERCSPGILDAARAAIAAAKTDPDFIRLDHKSYFDIPVISFDCAVMEKAPAAAVVPVDMGWSDIGNWLAVWDASERDEADNRISGNVVSKGVSASYVRADGPLTVVVGLNNVIVVTTEDAVLVAAKDTAQDVKAIVDHLVAQQRPEAITGRTVFRPWGSYASVHHGAGFQVKQISVNPGAKLSLQKHFRRAEHWTVVKGTALVTRDDEVFMLQANESTFIPLGAVHRLENPGKIPLELIEVQCGEYLGEDDIVRLDDAYGRN